MIRRTLKHGVGAALLIAFFAGADWLQFRGPNSAGVGDSAVPTEWSVGGGDPSAPQAKNVTWKVTTPGRSVAGVIVVNGRVIATAASGFKSDRLHVLCYDAKSGKELWHRQFWATGRTLCHPTSSVAANTPCSDGKFVYALFSCNDIFCLDLDGNLQWCRGLTHDYPTAANDVGMASSPVLAGNTVIVQIENEVMSLAIGLNKETGEERWKLERGHAMNWASPTVLKGKTPADDLVVLQSPTMISAHQPDTGVRMWQHDSTCERIASSVSLDGKIFVPTGDALLLLTTEPGSASVQVGWKQNKLSTGSASPVIHDSKVFAINKAGVLTCGEASDGKLLWQQRLKGPFWATPVFAGGKIYCANQEGTVFVVDPAKDGERIVAQNECGGKVFGTPAVVDGAMYVRTESTLFRVAGQ